ncbi:hypothetical protein POM88_052557 [Heracleum sosnowskyi]|uniref:Uncharacterized protein n=1 Tax=Heracleum sosnowskyi TaxID=360622 RepID=A0AAD8GQT0_9APIA|nr:hypothetical protein POM88_052557 [Heracleum sosnowskyi]
MYFRKIGVLDNRTRLLSCFQKLLYQSLDGRVLNTDLPSLLKKHPVQIFTLQTWTNCNAADNSTFPYDLYDVPYSEEYKTFLLKVAELLHKAGDMTRTPRFSRGTRDSWLLLASPSN